MSNPTFPLHPAQFEIYVDQLINPESPCYNIGLYIKLNGPLNKEIFHQAVNSSPTVFDAFKMRFDFNDTDPVCYFDENYVQLDLTEIDFSNKNNPKKEAFSWMQNQFNIPFKIQKENFLFENFLIKISSDEHWFFFRYHHLITDAFGFVVWLNYVTQKYRALLTCDDLQFNYPLYKAAAIDASYYRNSAAYELSGSYWKNKIVNKPDGLLRKKITQQKQQHKSGNYYITLNHQQQHTIQKLLIATKSNLQQLTIAALLTYYTEVSEQSEVIFGIPVHKRSTELRNILGMFSGILPFKCDLKRDLELADLLKQISASRKEDYAHQDYLIVDLIRSLKIKASESFLYDIVINYVPFNFDLNFGENMQTTAYWLQSEYEKLPLQICWRDYTKQQSLELGLHYSYNYFTPEEIKLFADRILFILEQFTVNPDTNIQNIKILPEKELQILSVFNNTKVEYDLQKNIVDLFNQQVERTPHLTAIVHNHEVLTYQQLNEKANQLAHFLKSKGVKQETLVPICIERGLNMIIGILGILKAGGAYVPVDPEYPQERINYMLEDTAASIIVSSKTSRTKLQSSNNFDVIELDTDWSIIQKQSTANLQNNIAPHQLAYVIYTSGSTGKPKGVMIEHCNVYSFVSWCMHEFSKSNFEIVYAGTSICFDLSIFEIFYPLCAGKPLRIIESGLYIGKYLPEDSNVLINTVPSVIQHLLNERTDLRNISVLNMAGEPISLQVQQALDADKIEIRNLYGPTEDTTYSTIHRLKNGEAITIGHPISNTQIYIVTKQIKLAPVGITGEICIGGEGLARGYLNRATLTTEKFIQNPFSETPGARIYKTGDLGRWLPDGSIEYLGRSDNQIKIRGYRIELGEIESVLQQSNLVKQVAVAVKENTSGLKHLVGYIVPKDFFEKETVISYLKNRLPEYMVPAIWIELKELPQTSNGKIDRKALPDPADFEQLKEKYVAPGNEIEKKLATIWEELLGIERAGVNDNFFELGGDSILVMRMASYIERSFLLSIPINVIFKFSNIKTLGKYLSNQAGVSFQDKNNTSFELVDL